MKQGTWQNCGRKVQFHDQHLPRPVIKEVLDRFVAKEEWATAAWFFFPNGWIEKLENGKVVAAAPMDILEDTETVLSAAVREQLGTYFA